jgi:hypothetical protein
MKKILITFFLSISILLFLACPEPPQPPQPVPLYVGEGSVMHVHWRLGDSLAERKAWVYIIGGLDENENPTDTVLYTELDSSGQLTDGNWYSAGTLPSPLAWTAAISYGNQLHLFGGDTGSGPTDRSWLTQIREDGTLGYGASRTWIGNLRRIPYALSHTAAVLHDGRVLLCGGKLATGAATDHIIHARFYQDGQVGNWYYATEELATPLKEATAVVGYPNSGSLLPILYIAGGIDSSGSLQDTIEAFSLGEYGKLEPLSSPVLSLPVSARNPIIVPAIHDTLTPCLPLLFAANTTDEEFLVYASSDGSAWQQVVAPSSEALVLDVSEENPSVPTVETELLMHAPGFAVIEGNLLLLGHGEAEESALWYLTDLALPPSAPIIHPGSGYIPYGSPILVRAAPLVQISFTESSPDTSTFSLPLGGKSHYEYELYSIDAAGRSSGMVSRTYHIRSTSFIVNYESTIYPQTGSAGFTPLFNEQESIEPYTESANWYRLVVNSSGYYALRVQGGGLSLFEVDLTTLVPDSQAVPIEEPFSEDMDVDAERSYTVLLASGSQYYMQVQAPELEGSERGSLQFQIQWSASAP